MTIQIMTLVFLQLRWLDVLDIVLVAWLIFLFYKLIKGTVAVNIFIGILSFYVLWKLVEAVQMKMLSEILGQFIGVGVIALLIVFQQEIRRFLLILGNTAFLSNNRIIRFFAKLSPGNRPQLDIDLLLRSVSSMSTSKCGALIVIARQGELEEVQRSGELLEARISQTLIESIFFKNSPLHDGAILIIDNRIRAARCVLPLTRNPEFPADYGLRHRAAAGITESSDAIAIVVSEQDGAIAFCSEGKLTTKLKPEQLQALLEKEFEISTQTRKGS
jgi:diadenylate cyclase